MQSLKFWIVALSCLAVGIAAGDPTHSRKQFYTPHDKAYFLPDSAEFVNPGLTIAVQSAAIASDGTITATYTVSDPTGLPLDIAGVTHARHDFPELPRRRNSERAGAVRQLHYPRGHWHGHTRQPISPRRIRAARRPRLRPASTPIRLKPKPPDSIPPSPTRSASTARAISRLITSAPTTPARHSILCPTARRLSPRAT